MHPQQPQVLNTANLEKLSGIVKRITFHSPETGWTILKVAPFNRATDEVAVIVHQSKVFAGATMEFYGNWAQHPKFGEQFKAVKVVELKPATANALEKYLGSGLIKGVGPGFAKRIVKHFSKDTLEVFDTDIDRLLEVPGIARKKLETIMTAWEVHKDIKDVMLFLQSYDISTLFAVKIYKTYGNKSIQTVSENPYRLAKDIYGIGFFSADKVALSMGYSLTSEQRIRAGIEHVLDASREEGHCYLTQSQIIKQVNELRFQKALEINPNFADAHCYLGNALLQRDNSTRPLSNFEKPWKSIPALSQPTTTSAMLYYKTGNWTRPLSNFKRPWNSTHFSDAHCNLGSALFQKGQLDEAVAQFQKALEINPSSFATHYNLGNALFEKGQLDQTIAQFQEALRLKPDFSPAQDHLAKVQALVRQREHH